MAARHSLNLSQLVQQSDTIVHGYVVSAHVERHPQLTNLETVVVTLHVVDTLKGTPEKSFTFRQYVWDVRDRKNALGYQKGQEVMLMMIRPSQYGLSSPAGLDQGRFRIIHDKTGKAYAVNGNENRALFVGVESEATSSGVTLPSAVLQRARSQRAGPISLDDLKQAIRGFAGVGE